MQSGESWAMLHEIPYLSKKCLALDTGVTNYKEKPCDVTKRIRLTCLLHACAIICLEVHQSYSQPRVNCPALSLSWSCVISLLTQAKFNRKLSNSIFNCRFVNITNEKLCMCQKDLERLTWLHEMYSRFLQGLSIDTANWAI